MHSDPPKCKDLKEHINDCKVKARNLHNELLGAHLQGFNLILTTNNSAGHYLLRDNCNPVALVIDEAGLMLPRLPFQWRPLESHCLES
jgi:hypothetical protein